MTTTREVVILGDHRIKVILSYPRTGWISSMRERDGCPNVAMNAMTQALRRIGQSHFFEQIEHTKILRHFTHLMFTC